MRLVNYTSITRQDMKCSIEELVWINDVFYIQIDRKDKKGNWYWHTTFKIKDPRLPLKNICACIFAAKLFWALKGTFFSSTQDVILKILIWVVKKNRARTDQMKITVLLEKILLAFISEGIYECQVILTVICNYGRSFEENNKDISKFDHISMVTAHY